jgi:hypothetical protein
MSRCRADLIAACDSWANRLLDQNVQTEIGREWV